MSKEDTASGLLSKMVKFVRNPTTSWSDLDQAEADREDSMSKQLLKEMIERKRRNDFVRKREFDMLLKMRKREALAGTDPDAAGRPSFFQSSMPSKPDDRASTLKKIDEIEAQMSMQWWKTKNAAVQAGAAAATEQPADRYQLPMSYSATVPAGLQSAATKAATPAPAQGQTPAPTLIAGELLLTGGLSLPVPPLKPIAGPVSKHPASSFGFASPASDFSSSKFFAVENGGIFTHDTELEEAAIRFANGDDEGAETGLLDILGPGGPRENHPETWLTLFDLYRASAQQDKFELAAIQFVERFSRSAPQWFSMPAMVKMLSPSSPVKAGNGPASDWVCPSVVGIQTVAALKAAVAKAAMPWRLDWSHLKSIEESAVAPMYQVFSAWAAEPVQLRFTGNAQLQKVLQAATPSNNRNIAQEAWQLRLQVLRVTHRPDDFELAALDFCVTYEVSPPAWENALCDYKSLDPAGGSLGSETIIGDVYRDFAASLILGGSDSQMDSQMSVVPAGSVLAVELAGTIQGDAIAVLDKLGHKLNGADIMVISCAKLIRVDFSAAGSLLNWVAARQAENRVVQFSDVNRLVAAFFNVIGITENAKVVVRVD